MQGLAPSSLQRSILIFLSPQSLSFLSGLRALGAKQMDNTNTYSYYLLNSLHISCMHAYYFYSNIGLGLSFMFNLLTLQRNVCITEINGLRIAITSNTNSPTNTCLEDVIDKHMSGSNLVLFQIRLKWSSIPRRPTLAKAA